MPWKAAVITVSDRAAGGQRADQSGPLLVEQLEAAGFPVVKYQIIPDEPRILATVLTDTVELQRVPLVVLTGGTGLGPRDRVPQLLDAWATRVWGFGERIRSVGGETNPRAILSRGGAWQRSASLILALPGSPGGARESLSAVLGVLDHALSVLGGGDHPPGGAGTPGA